MPEKPFCGAVLTLRRAYRSHVNKVAKAASIITV
jgi:uncharacterized C2H2 Zn-finger protein